LPAVGVGTSRWQRCSPAQGVAEWVLGRRRGPPAPSPLRTTAPTRPSSARRAGRPWWISREPSTGSCSLHVRVHVRSRLQHRGAAALARPGCCGAPAGLLAMIGQWHRPNTRGRVAGARGASPTGAAGRPPRGGPGGGKSGDVHGRGQGPSSRGGRQLHPHNQQHCPTGSRKGGRRRQQHRKGWSAARGTRTAVPRHPVRWCDSEPVP
jgi:hypothetical protein